MRKDALGVQTFALDASMQSVSKRKELARYYSARVQKKRMNVWFAGPGAVRVCRMDSMQCILVYTVDLCSVDARRLNSSNGWALQ